MKIIRVITTERGTNFNVFAETDHFIMCQEPINGDTLSKALLDIEFMSSIGYWLCHINHGHGGVVVFEKRSVVEK